MSIPPSAADAPDAPIPGWETSGMVPVTEEAFRQWVESTILRHYRNLYLFALSLTKNEADAADLTQQTAVILATKGREIRDAAQVKSWLYTTLHREFLHLRRRGQRGGGAPDVLVHSEEAGEGHPAAQERQLDARTAVAALKRIGEPHGSILALYYLEDLSYREIAGVLDVPVGTVMSRLSRAKDALRKLLNLSPA